VATADKLAEEFNVTSPCPILTTAANSATNAVNVVCADFMAVGLILRLAAADILACATLTMSGSAVKLAEELRDAKPNFKRVLFAVNVALPAKAAETLINPAGVASSELTAVKLALTLNNSPITAAKLQLLCSETALVRILSTSQIIKLSMS